MSNEWETFVLEHGIERQHTARATPQQNEVAECTNRILDEGVSSLLSDSHFPARFWGEALSCYLLLQWRYGTGNHPSLHTWDAWTYHLWMYEISQSDLETRNINQRTET